MHDATPTRIAILSTRSPGMDEADAEGCTELASDSPIENVVSHAAHRALGFEETERVVYFRRPVHDN